MAGLTTIEKSQFLKLFNRDGHVLDFSTTAFDIFTMESVGLALCDHYRLSKGKSLIAYVNEADDDAVNKLFHDLLLYYEAHYEPEYNKRYGKTEETPYSNYYYDWRYDSEFSRLYYKCKEIADRVFSSRNIPLAPAADKLKDKFSSDYLSSQIDNMLSMTASNPTEAIGKAKELIESCCITILDAWEIAWDKNWDVGQLAGETMKHLKLMPRDIPDNVPAAAEMKAVLGNLRAIATNIAALRNSYGSGHGKGAAYRGLEERHAKLAVGSSITLVEFLWEAHENAVNQ